MSICFCSSGCADSLGAREHASPWYGQPPCPCWCHRTLGNPPSVKSNDAFGRPLLAPADNLDGSTDYREQV
jgi:hypothetical protein